MFLFNNILGGVLLQSRILCERSKFIAKFPNSHLACMLQNNKPTNIPELNSSQWTATEFEGSGHYLCYGRYFVKFSLALLFILRIQMCASEIRYTSNKNCGISLVINSQFFHINKDIKYAERHLSWNFYCWNDCQSFRVWIFIVILQQNLLI